MFLNALGVYIGRYLRLNSWDILTDPFQLFKDISNLAMHPLQYKYAWAMIVCFSIILTLIFLTLMFSSTESRKEETLIKSTN